MAENLKKDTKTGGYLKLPDLVEKLNADQLVKNDAIIPASALSMNAGQLIVTGMPGSTLNAALAGTGVIATGTEEIRLDVLEICDNQIAEKLAIPPKYYQKMRESALPLLDHNVNHWLKEVKGNYFLRTFSPRGDGGVGVARALLSDRFRTIDNLDVLMATLDTVKGMDRNLQIEHCALSDKKMYVSFTAPDVVVNSKELLSRYRLPGTNEGGNPAIMTGFILSNSETGHGAFQIIPRIVVQVCSNGMIAQRDALKHIHLGTKLEQGVIHWSDDTNRKNMELVISQVKDAVTTFISEEYLGGLINRLLEEGSYQIQHPIAAVNNVCKAYQISEERTKSILDFFTKSGDPTSFGVAQAVTYYAQQVEPDLRYEYEAMAVDMVGDVENFDYELAKN